MTIINVACRGKRRYKSWELFQRSEDCKNYSLEKKTESARRSSPWQRNFLIRLIWFFWIQFWQLGFCKWFWKRPRFPRCSSSPLNCEQVMESLPWSNNNEGSLDELFLSSLIQNVIQTLVMQIKGSDGGGQLLSYPCEAEFSRFFLWDFWHQQPTQFFK